MASTSSHHLSTQPAHIWPAPATVHQPHQHSRVFIGPYLASSSKFPDAAAAAGKAPAQRRYSSADVEEGDDYHVHERKRDVVRRQKRKVLQRRRASSSAAWGDEDADDEHHGGRRHLRHADGHLGSSGPKKLMRWVDEARGKDGGGGVHGREVSGMSAQEIELVNTIMAPVRDEDAGGGRGWWKIRWEGDKQSTSASSNNSAAAAPPVLPHVKHHPTRGPLHASSSTGSTTMVSKRFLTSSSSLLVASPEMSLSELPLSKTETEPQPKRKPYLLDPRNNLRRPSRQGSEHSVETFYSARTDLFGDEASATVPSEALVAAPTPPRSDDDVESRVLSCRFASSPTESLLPPRPKHLQTTPLPQIIHTDASPTGSTSSFRPFLNMPVVPAAPLRSALRKPSSQILKDPTVVSAPAVAQNVHFPPSPTPSISHLLDDLRTRAGGRDKRAIEDRAEVIGSSGPLLLVQGDAEPAPPEEVLSRQGGAGVEGDGSPMTATLYDEAEEDLHVGDIVMRDRMLVKKQWSRSSGLPPGYNEQTQRKIPVDRSDTWEERLVVLKKGRVEIYEDWALPLREKLVGVKKLGHVIYLQKETSLSLYSHTDLTFCLLTPPTSLKDARTTRNPSGIKSRMPRFTRDGTSIFIFKCKSRTRAIDWMWELYLQLHGPNHLPRYLDVHVPTFNNARVRIRVPVVGEDPGFDSIEAVLRRLTRKQVIRHCARILNEVEGFRSLLVECGALSAEDEGNVRVKGNNIDKHLALAWRFGERLDWIWADEDVIGKGRDWNVLVGAGPLQSLTQPAKLELRLARHTASILHLKSGVNVTEPPAIEGYIHRIRTKTQAKTLTYLTTHDGNLFICSPFKAHPPIPPATVNVKRDASGRRGSVDSMPTNERDFLVGERIRAIQQILGSNGFIDFRDIVEVSRATTVHVDKPRSSSVSCRSGFGSARNGNTIQDEEEDDGWESLSEDERDPGGAQGYKVIGSENHKALQERRQILVRCSNGEIHHFEAHSALIAREWVDRLNSLRIYWTEKHLEEAKQEMEVSRSAKIRIPANVPGHKQRQWDDEEELEDPDDPPAFIEDFWNWCVLDGCRPIVKAGRLFSKRRHWQFRAKFNILVHGHLVQFSLDLGRPIHTRSHRFFLIDAYVYTGYLAQEGLPPSSNEDAYLGKGEPRRYADGLQTSDGSEDTVLVLWYRPHFTTTSATKYRARAQQDEQYVPPALGKAGHQKLVLRARSKLERDRWAWALNLEIERLSRRRREREERIRNAGGVY